jgi:parvulin-like peptidyl-prolyl cis-trans isomerase-like protein
MRLFREPLLHFLLAGAALFGAYAWLPGDRDSPEDNSRTVYLRQADVDWIKQIWSRQWHREPTQDELRGLVADYIKEELFAREAHDMKLDENDIVLRHRLAQKLSFLIEDAVQVAQPTDADLQRHYAAHPDRFQSGARITFSQIYFNPETRKDPLSDAKRILERIGAASKVDDPAEMGDRLLVDSDFRQTDEQTVSTVFGPEFARTIFALEPGSWSGPIRSGFGVHLARISELQKSQPLPYAAARPQLLAEWQREQEQGAYEKFMQELRKKYKIVADDSVKSIIDMDLTNGSAAR